MVRGSSSMSSRSRRQSTEEEEALEADNDLTEEDMEKLRKALRILTEKMDDSSALKALEKMTQQPENDDSEESTATKSEYLFFDEFNTA